jgi:ParB family chromosome partitioning protein
VEIQSVPLQNIRVRESRYLFLQVSGLNGNDTILKTLASSLKNIGVQEPFLLHQVNDELHLVDGFKRALVADTLGIESVPCCFLPEDTAIREIVAYLLIEQNNSINSSLAARACFVNLVQKLGLDEQTLIQYVFPLIGLQGHKAVLKKVEAIGKLPHQVLIFCHEKNFSMRQCNNLTSYAVDLLRTVFSWKNELSLTASMVEEILSNIKDLLRKEGMSLNKFLEDREIQNLLNSSLSLHEKTKHFRFYIKRRRFPVLTDMNIKMEKIKNKIPLPENISLAWDQTLEKRELQLLLKIHEPEELEKTLDALKVKKISEGIGELLENV